MNEPPVQQQEGGDARQQVEGPPAPRAIEDLETWLQTHGLHGDTGSEEATLDRLEELERFRQHAKYQDEVHSRIFKKDEETEARKRQRLDSWEAHKLEFSTSSNDATVVVPLRPFAASCDTIFALAASQNLWTPNSKTPEHLSLSLGYSERSVRHFVSLVLGTKTLAEIPEDTIVDCCYISHYVQNTTLLQHIATVLLEAVDTDNCLSLSQLADHLQLNELWERSLTHMMDTLQDVSAAQDDMLTPELRNRISSIQSAISCSLNSQSRLYFSSLEEYVAIFAERVQYYRERLAEAQEQQKLLLNEDEQDNRPPSSGWFDAQAKIEKQQRRLKTLELALQEQKKLFLSRRGDQSYCT